MLRAATVSIVNEDGFAAGEEAALELKEELQGPPELILLFSSAGYNHEQVLKGIYGKLPHVALVGCSSYAEINSEDALTNSVTAMGLQLDGIAFKSFRLDEVGPDSFAAGVAFAAEIKAFAPNLLLVFTDGMQCNATRFLLGLQEVLGRTFPIIGGVAADLGEFARTYEFIDQSCISGGVVGVALKGSIELVTAAKSGWIPVGGSRICTKVEHGNTLVELDGKPALSLYREYLQHRVSEMPRVSAEYPIGIVGGVAGTQRLPDDDILLVRFISGVDEAREAIIFGGDIPEGAEVRMTRATKEDVIRGANEAGAAACSAMGNPSVVFVFDCMGRKVVLGGRYRDELKETFKRIGKNIPKIGFYTFGELSPVQGVTMHHNETFTIALLKA